jgi:3-mercaptopyruvate sulfurtransferase SseA
MLKPLTPDENIQVLRRLFGFTRTKNVTSSCKKGRRSSESMTSPHEEGLSENEVLAKKKEGLQRFNTFWLGDE